MNDLLPVGTRVVSADSDLYLGEGSARVAGVAFTTDPKVLNGPQRVCYVLALEPGFYAEGRRTFVSALIALPENVKPDPARLANFETFEEARDFGTTHGRGFPGWRVQPMSATNGDTRYGVLTRPDGNFLGTDGKPFKP